jgi:hypothetical protein
VVDFSLAQVQRELLLLHRASFGDALRSYVPCPACGARLELETQVSSLLSRDLSYELSRELCHGLALEGSHEPSNAFSQELGHEAGGEFSSAPGGPRKEATWRHGAVVHSMRAATSRDLTALMLTPDPRARLLELCMEGAPVEGCGGADCEAMAVEYFNRVNEEAEIWLTLHCAACATRQSVNLDIGRFLWAEVRHAAVSLLREVHQLAAAYGWAESAILGMSSARRSIYLGMTAGA